MGLCLLKSTADLWVNYKKIEMSLLFSHLWPMARHFSLKWNNGIKWYLTCMILPWDIFLLNYNKMKFPFQTVQVPSLFRTMLTWPSLEYYTDNNNCSPFSFILELQQITNGYLKKVVISLSWSWRSVARDIPSDSAI